MNVQPSAEAERVPKASLEALFEAEQSPLLRYAFGLVGRREVAEELVQDAFLRLHQHWDEVEVPRAWLFRCVRNRAFNHLRSSKRETLSSPEMPDVYQQFETGEAKERGQEAPDDVLGRLEAAGLMHVLLGELKRSDRELVHLKYIEGLKYRAIAERTGMTVGNIGYRLHHILKNLAESLRRAGVEGTRG